TINTNTGHTSATAKLFQTRGQTVVDLPPTHVCRIDGCGLEFYIEYTLIAHQRDVHKTTEPTVHFLYDTSGVDGSDSAVGLGVGCANPMPSMKSGCAHNGCGLSFAPIPDLKRHQLYDKHRLTVHSTAAATETVHKTTAQEIHFRYEKIGVNSDRPIETTTVLPVQSISATIHSDNSDMDSDLEVINIIPEPKPTVHTVSVRPITGHTSKRLLIE
ncbi:unnamed protein product, partial [Medioppia subpectinata]